MRLAAPGVATGEHGARESAHLPRVLGAWNRGKPVVLAPTASRSGQWPPDDLPNFLGVQVLEPVPTTYLKLIKTGSGPVS